MRVIDNLLESSAFFFIQEMRHNIERPVQKTGRRGTFSSNAIATKTLYNELRFVLTSRPDGANLKIIGPDYWTYADRGRGFGGVPSVQIFIDWIKNKGFMSGSTQKEIEGAAWAIRKSIAKHGTAQPPSQFFGKAVGRFLFELFRDIERFAPQLFENEVTPLFDELEER